MPWIRRAAVVFICFATLPLLAQQPSPPVKMSLNDAWRFLPDDRFEAENPGHDDSKWDVVDVPHT